MSKIPYEFNLSLLGSAYLENDYENLKGDILENLDCQDYFFEEQGEYYGFSIKENKPLHKLYEFDFWIVDIFFTAVETLDDPENNKPLKKLFTALNKKIREKKGYYTLRIPSNFVGVLKTFNDSVEKAFLCGGIASYLRKRNHQMYQSHSKAITFFADKDYVKNRKEELITIAKDAFDNYHGQYNTSSVTDKKAHAIYSDWLKRSFDEFKENSIVVSEYEGGIATFITLDEKEEAINVGIGGTSSNYLGVGAYTASMNFAIEYSKKVNKHFITGTQLDNFVVQAAYGKLGLIPFSTTYNFHLDNR